MLNNSWRAVLWNYLYITEAALYKLEKELIIINNNSLVTIIESISWDYVIWDPKVFSLISILLLECGKLNIKLNILIKLSWFYEVKMSFDLLSI